MKNITITIIKNPFNPDDRIIKYGEFIPQKSIYEYVQSDIMGLDAAEDIIYSKNGVIVQKDNQLEPGDFVAICPVIGKGGAKKVLSIVASIALMVYSGNIAKGLTKNVFLRDFYGHAISMVGGMIINHLFPQPKPDIPEISTANPEYSWGNLQSLTGQGNALAVTYGTMKTAGQILAQHVTNDGEKQYLNVLLCGGEGSIESISDIRINDNSISNYKDVIVETRLGINDQTVIQNFNDTYADQNLSYELVNDGTWATHKTEGNGGQGIEVNLELPSGLYHVKDDGGLENATVKVEMQYRKEGTDEWNNIYDKIKHSVNADGKNVGKAAISNIQIVKPVLETWTLKCTEVKKRYSFTRIKKIPMKFSCEGSVSGKTQDVIVGQNYNNGFIQFNINAGHFGDIGDTYNITLIPEPKVDITAAQNTPVRRTYRVDGLLAGRYEVRCRCAYKSGIDTRYSTRIFWTQLSHIIYDDFCRPGKVLIGIRALATEQLSGGVPAVTWIQTRDNVYIWNPNTSQYEKKSARNPAWAAYDLIHRCRKIKRLNDGQEVYSVFGIPANRIMYQDFADWAAFCDKHGLAFEYIFDTASDLWNALQKPESVGRGKVVMKGTKYACVCDRPSQPVQLFTVGNIFQDQWQEEFLGMKDRANAVEISFVNRDKGYQKDSITVYANEWDESETVKNPTQITLYGCTSYEQAYKAGKYFLKLNQYLLRTISFEVDIDAIACQIGDVILVQHDVPQWGYGGRINFAASDRIVLDRKVVIEKGKQYQVVIRTTNPNAVDTNNTERLLWKTVKNAEDTSKTDTIIFTEPLEVVPQKDDVYSFGEVNKVVKPFRVLNITRSQELKRRIAALEYIEAIYAEADNIPVINYSGLDEAVIEVEKLDTGQETYQQKDGTVISTMYISWKLPRGKKVKGFSVYYSRDDGQTWQWYTNTDVENIIISDLKALETYRVKVCTINEVGVVSQGVISKSVYITGKDNPPSNILKLTAVIDPTDSTKVLLSWPAVTDVDLRGYQIMEGDIVLTPTPITDIRYTYTAAVSRQYDFSVKAIDNSGNLSQLSATSTIQVIIEPAQVAGFTITIQETDRSKVMFAWQANMEKDISHYEIRHGNDWDTAQVIATQLKATSYLYTLPAEGSQNYLIKAINVAGKYSVAPALKTIQVILRPDTPANLTADQESKDRSLLRLSWTASPGKDIAGYEIRCGTNWENAGYIAFTKETAYCWTIPASGSYNIMVKAKSVAGYMSNVSNVTCSPMIEPFDVANFAALQKNTDRTQVRLSWDRPLSLDVAYFEIRKGVTWDTGQVIDERVTGTFYDVIVLNETLQTFWIKAVSVAGKKSQNPAKAEGAFNMNPSPVSNIQIRQNPNDKSIVNIMWSGVNDGDLAGYQVKIGQTWDNAEALPLTQELYCEYNCKQTGDIKVMIKTINTAGFYSDEVFTHYYVTLEPLDVTEFQVLQNGENVEFYWDKITEPDVLAYEIREGSSFELGALVDSGITLNSHKVKVDVERNYQYHIKAINRSNHYSQRATSQSVFVSNLPPKNVILEYDEIARKDGTHNNSEFGASLINFSNIGGKFSDYPMTKFSDVGGRTVLKLKKQAGKYMAAGQYNCKIIDVGQVITANISNQFVSTVNLRGFGSAILQTRTSQDGTNWTQWQDFRPAQYTFRYLDRRVLIETEDPTKTPEVNQLTTRIDVPDKEFTGTVKVPAGGTTVTFTKPFYTIPVITPTAIGDNRFAVVISKDKYGFKVKIADRTGNDVGGQLDYRARGY